MKKQKKEQETQIISSRSARRTRGLILAAGALLIAVIVAVAVITLPKKSQAKELAEALDLGDKYLSELNYEQAVASYRAAIEIDPKCADAYIGLADTYLAMGDPEEANRVLEQAEQAVAPGIGADEEEKRKAETALKRIREKKEEAEKKAKEAAQPTSTPEAEPTPEPTPRECKIVCVFGKKYLFFGKNQDMTILIEKEYFYASSKTTNTTDYCR